MVDNHQDCIGLCGREEGSWGWWKGRRQDFFPVR